MIPNRSGRMIRRSSSSTHVVLRTQRQPSEPALHDSEPRKGTWEEDTILNARPAKADRLESTLQRARPDENCVFVERACVDRAYGQRVEWIVLEDHQLTVGFQDSPQLSEQSLMLARR